MSLLEYVFIPINSRFSSIMVKDGENGGKHWKKVTVKLDDHVQVPIFPDGLPLESYDEYLQEYWSCPVEQLPQSRPLWKIHIFKYPTTIAAGTIFFKLHHALGDVYSLMGALFSCLQRSDNPSLFRRKKELNMIPILRHFSNYPLNVSGLLAVLKNTVTDFTWSLMKSSFLEDHVSPIRSATVGVELKPITISTVAFSLDQIKQIKTKLGGTFTNVIVGILFYGTRLYMEAVSKGSGNAQSTALVLLHVPILEKFDIENADPLEFVFEAKKKITEKKKFIGSLSKRIIGNIMTISNLIGPVEKMSLENHPIKGLYFVVVNSPQVSYMGKLRVTVGGEKELINHRQFNSCLDKSFERILEAALNLP
ncbi:hypothetical protein MKX01_017689 [Papaver californicum]|nr:hypothetical protein MKX01_017689 [Papaver californicum]